MSFCCGRTGWSRPTLDLSCVRYSVVDPGSAVDIDAVGLPGILGSACFADTYDLGAVIGSGTAAVVRHAVARGDSDVEDVSEVQAFAVKCVSSRDLEVHQFVLEEYRVLQSLQHDCIIHAEALYTNCQYSLMVMELCDENVQMYVERCGPIAETLSISLSKQLLSATNYLHDRRICHRDVKPENLLLSDSARKLKLTDFNSAKRIGSADDSAVMLSARGTHQFSAPELLAGHVWNERVDIWACGLSSFYMVCAELPFNCTDPDVKELLVVGRCPDILWDGVPPLLRHLLEQCLAVDMRDRPPAMELLQHRLFVPKPPRRVLRICTDEANVANHELEGVRRQYSAPEMVWSTLSKDVPSPGSEALRQLQLSKLARTTWAAEAADRDGRFPVFTPARLGA